MASIGKDPNGRKRILFVASDGKRKTIRLGKTSLKQAEAFKLKLEALIAGRFSCSIDSETARWIADLPDDIHNKLSAVGLVTQRASVTSQTLEKFLNEYTQSRSDVKHNTQTVYGRTVNHLITHFGSDRLLSDITPGQADEWRLYLVKCGLAQNTTNRTCGIARQFFRAAQRRKLIDENPFSELKSSVGSNKAREYFLSRQDAEKVIETCPDTQWRLIFTLARYGGLRTPSEILLLKWADVNWEKHRILVHSPKTEHHPGGESRLIPIFPELYPHLLAAYEEAETGTEYVITSYRKAGLNLRTQLMRIIAKAGLKPWPKLFQNLRSTRETELTEHWPEHVVCNWLGNTRIVARKHYLQITDEHFEKAAQNAAQYEAVQVSNNKEVTMNNDNENADLPLVTAKYSSGKEFKLGGTGLEPVTSCVSSTRSSQLS
jgi:integrase